MSQLSRILAATAIAGLLVVDASAERMTRIGSFEAHYSLVPTMLLSPAVAADYRIARGRDRALLNVTILNARSEAVQARVRGVVRDLLGIPADIGFREVLEGEAVYYLAEIRYPDQEVLRFTIDVDTPDGASHQFSFQQKMYWEEP
jgi:hypothetical protein